MANFNIPPYYDDYSESKNYYKVLFRPSVAIQARELNQLQSMVQKQIERFGSHIFKEGSIVVGGAFDLELDVSYVKASSILPSSTRLNDLVGKTVVGNTTKIQAVVRAVQYDSSSNSYAILLRYLSASLVSDVFLNEEVVTASDDASLGFTVVPSTVASYSGFGSIFSIGQGVVFSKGYFLAFPKQTVILEKYSRKPTKTIGLLVSERIVTELSDTSLNDNSLGTTNENAPGAHRYNIEAALTVIPYKTGNENENFINLLHILNGNVETTKERTQYSRIYDEIAKRTYDESGDYFVNGLNLITREHLDTGANEGLLKASQGGDANKLSVDISPGVAYVKGFEVDKLVTENVIIDKATEFRTVNNQLINARTGGYFLIKEVTGNVDHDSNFIVNLYSAAETRITRKKTNLEAVDASNVLIGTARVKAVIYDSGVQGTPTAVYRIYLHDFDMNSKYIVSDVRGIGCVDSPNKFFADVVTETTSAGITKVTFYESNKNTLLFETGSRSIKTIRSAAGTVDTTFQFIRSENKTANVANTTSITVSVSTTGESLAYSTGTLSTAEKREIMLSLNSNTLIQLPGTISVSGANVVGVGTSFQNLTVGDRIYVNSNNYLIRSIVNSSVMTFASAISPSFTGNVFFKSMLAGDIIDLTSDGSTGNPRTVTVSSGVLSVDLKEVATNVTPTSVSAKIAYRVQRSTAAEVKKILKPNRYVKLYANTNSREFNLGLADVYKIRSIRMDSAAFTNATGSASSSNVTTAFTFDNGQKDNRYGHAKVIYKGSASAIAGKHFLVTLDHFVPDYSGGFGYFSVDSYPVDDVTTSDTTIFTYQIPTYTSSFGKLYNLKNTLDFRPVEQPTANSADTVGTASTNPATTTQFVADTDGLRMVAPDSDISADYSFYLPRKDVITLDTKGAFNVVKGEAATTPITPSIPDAVMGIATVFIPPYPSISQRLSRILNVTENVCTAQKIANIRYTMKDIDVLRKRIEALEYYNALTLLEKSTVDLKVLDENGQDRFKNGYFVDGFADLSLGDTGNPDFKIAVDKNAQVIRPFFNMDSFDYRIETGGSSNYINTGDLITMPYTEVTMLENKHVTTIRNIEQSVFRYIGTVDFTPEVDTWVDTTTVTKNFQLGNQIPLPDTMYSEWGSWQTYGVGSSDIYTRFTNLNGATSGPTVDAAFANDPFKKLIASFNSYAEATAYWKTNIDGVKNDNNVYIDTIENQKSTRTATSYTFATETDNIGNFVTDVSVKPYIRPQTIQVFVRGIKPNTRMYCFFDGEDMSDYCTQLTETDVDGTVGISFGVEGAALRSDIYGELLFLLRLPVTGKRFTIGTKEVFITDSPTNAEDATTYAKGTWSASGLKVEKQNTIISTKTPVKTITTQTRTREVESIEAFGGSCMAYSFKVKAPPDEDGVFLTSVDFWVSAKHPTLGIWFEVREMDNAGGITRTQVPGSEVWLKTNQVNIWDGNPATEASKYTRITFKFPIFLMNDTQYAFIMHTEGINPDYYFWVSRLGETDILTNKPVTGRQLTGTLYTTNNNLNYDMVLDVDLKVRFNRAQFQTGTATIMLGNKPVEFLNTSNNDGDFLLRGENVFTSELLRFSDTATGANNIVVTDIIRGVTSGAKANVVSVSGPNYFVDYYGFKLNETFNVYDSANTAKSISGVVNFVYKGTGKLRNYSANGLMIIDDSNGGFYTGSTIFGEKSGDKAQIDSYSQFPYSTTTLKLYDLVFNKTFVTAKKAGWLSDPAANDFDTNSDSSMWFPGNIDTASDFNNEVTILSRNRELTKFGSGSPNSTARVQVIMGTASEYVSPVVDISKAKSIMVHNIINNDDTGEDATNGGNLLNRYISKIVTLADGQDAEDFIVAITAYKPPESDVKAWMKLKHGEDSRSIRNMEWVEMDYSNTVYSSDSNRSNFIELNYSVPANYKNGNGVYQYIRNAVEIYANTEWSNASGSYGIRASANAILIPDADTYFDVGDKVYYSVPPTGRTITGTYSNGSAIVPLTSNTYLYVNSVNSTAVTLNAAWSNSSGGTEYSQIDITEFRTRGEVHTLGGQVFTGYKNFTVKLGLKGTNSANPPKVSDLRAIALQM